jgi:hypothetical protein
MAQEKIMKWLTTGLRHFALLTPGYLPGSKVAAGRGSIGADVPADALCGVEHRTEEEATAEDQFRTAMQYYRGEGVPQDYEQAAQWCRKAAERGLAKAQNNLGFLYERGLGVHQSDVRAVHWYRTAAEQGDPEAQNNLGIMYVRGQGVERDDAQAARWFGQAALQGVGGAQNNLGVLYEKGRGVVRDCAQAIQWYRKAAAEGIAEAQHNLCLAYETGLGVAKDCVSAYVWFRRAAERGHLPSRNWQEAIAKRLSREELAHSERLLTEGVGALEMGTIASGPILVRLTESPRRRSGERASERTGDPELSLARPDGSLRAARHAEQAISCRSGEPLAPTFSERRRRFRSLEEGINPQPDPDQA